MRRAAIAVCIGLFGLIAACDAGETINTRPDGDSGRSDASRPNDVSTTMDVANPNDGGNPVDVSTPTDAAAGDVIARGALRPEICGNGYDDDDNGMIDDGCNCAVGTARACWLGPPAMRGVGACHDGVQNCNSDGTSATWGACNNDQMPGREVLSNGSDDDCDGTVDEPDGICLARSNSETGIDCGNGLDDDCDTRIDCDDPGCAGEARCPGGCATRETVCWGGIDDDCDTRIDCNDTDCATDPSCQTGPCPAGQTPTYRQRNLGSYGGGSSIAAGDGLPRMPMTCETGNCGQGEVAVVLIGQSRICVPPPPSCPMGQSPTYIASGRWRCDPPCTYIVHYGGLFGGRSVCAGRPMISCGSGTVPTFVEETETWECRPTCNNGLYDQITLSGSLVCVPC